MQVTVCHARKRMVCPKKLCQLRGSPQQVESILGPIGPEQQGKLGYRKYAEPRRINEIANQNLTSNQRVGSSSLSGRAISKDTVFSIPLVDTPNFISKKN